jgi:hypothetical protein
MCESTVSVTHKERLDCLSPALGAVTTGRTVLAAALFSDLTGLRPAPGSAGSLAVSCARRRIAVVSSRPYHVHLGALPLAKGAPSFCRTVVTTVARRQVSPETSSRRLVRHVVQWDLIDMLAGMPVAARSEETTGRTLLAAVSAPMRAPTSLDGSPGP